MLLVHIQISNSLNCALAKTRPDMQTVQVLIFNELFQSRCKLQKQPLMTGKFKQMIALKLSRPIKIHYIKMTRHNYLQISNLRYTKNM